MSRRPYEFTCTCGVHEDILAGGSQWAAKKAKKLNWRFEYPATWLCPRCSKRQAKRAEGGQA